MITTERKPNTERRPLAQRRQSTERAMAWRAAARGGVQPRISFEAILFGALLLPLALGACLVVALRHQAAPSSPLLPLLGAAVAGAAGLIYHIDGRRRERPLQAAIRVNATVRPGIGAGLAIALALSAALLTVNDQAAVAAALLWVAGLLVLLCNVVWLERPRLRPPTPIDAGALLGLLALAALLRLPLLNSLPSFVHSDEAQMALHTRIAAQGGMPTLFGTTDWWSVPWLGPALQAPLTLLVGDGLIGMRLASALAGILATAGLWFLGSELWSRRAGFVAALLFAVMAPSVHFSRDGIHYMQAVAALVWTVLCYTRATKRYSAAYAALTGILMGMDVQLYYAARLAVPLVFAHAAIRAMLEQGLLRNWLRLLLWTALGLAVAFLPMGAFYLAHPAAFAQRTDAVALFSGSAPVRKAIAHDYGHAGWPDILGRQVQRVILGFLAIGDRSEQYGAATPLLDPVTAALLPAACALALARLRQSPWLLCALWAAITLTLGGVLTTTQPDSPRLLAALPAACLLVGGLAHTLLTAAGETGYRDAKPLVAIGLAGALCAAATLNANSYLDAYPARAATQPVGLITDVARYLGRQQGDTPVVLYDHREFYLGHWTIQLLAPQVRGTTVWDAAMLEATLAKIRGPFLLIAVDRDGGDLARVAASYGDGRLVGLRLHDGRHRVVVYRYGGGGLA